MGLARPSLRGLNAPRVWPLQKRTGLFAFDRGTVLSESPPVIQACRSSRH
ncbi:MAG: hypothetical protein H7293_12355 [Candidatus Saccharibacteria bacterium]|nr:hypothetical protein [Rhodoferax sp.]